MPGAAKIRSARSPDFRSLEDDASTRHELVEGELSAMAGGSHQHAALPSTVTALVRSQLPLDAVYADLE